MNDAEAKPYASIGWYLGMIFQLADDCMDYEATKEQAKNLCFPTLNKALLRCR